MLQASDRITPELQYEKSWALALLDRVMRRLQAEYENADHLSLYEALQPLEDELRHLMQVVASAPD